MADPEPIQPQDMLFDANLQEFAQKISLICGLESNGKLSTVEAYQRIKALWKQLRRTKKSLRIGADLDSEDSAAG